MIAVRIIAATLTLLAFCIAVYAVAPYIQLMRQGRADLCDLCAVITVVAVNIINIIVQVALLTK